MSIAAAPYKRWNNNPAPNETDQPDRMNTLVLLLSFVATALAGGLPFSYSHLTPFAYHAPIALRSYIPQTQFRTQDILGQYNFGYATGNGIHRTETRGIDGTVVGRYGFVSPEGRVVDISYTAGPHGFVASGDAIPRAPALPIANVQATEEHLKAVSAVAVADEPIAVKETAPLYPTLYSAHPYTVNHPLVYSHHLPYASFGYNYIS